MEAAGPREATLYTVVNNASCCKSQQCSLNVHLKKKCSGIESIRSPACSKGRKVRKSKFTFNSISSQQWSNCVKIKLIFVHWSTFKIQPALGVCSSIYKGYIRCLQLNPSNNHTCVCVSCEVPALWPIKGESQWNKGYLRRVSLSLSEGWSSSHWE